MAAQSIVTCTITEEDFRQAWRRWLGDDTAEPPAHILEAVAGHASFIEGAMEDAALNLIHVLVLERAIVDTE